ncbi:LytTR family DNA-binding domain-containing protein [Rhodocytophaga aerolata]|uniref:LytTR family DNA-binding domain-containing protein n=1 Tax=Rhodocytophaga aerolata TaxID=455078 RepID=A0ABT8RAC5_9BACT|nr:LytTR family DNA-binding domain-containing protein [Rhodocytophaga aerolata]MDO1449058.1 LytTR family DNA-binding domain-containing protein [Rhodocytophaga aerolata]
MGTNILPSVPYADRWMKILCIPLWAIFFRHTAETAQVIDLLRSPQYYIDILYIMLASFVLWQINVYLIQWIDKRYSWAEETRKRFYIQGALGYGITALLIASFSVVYYTVVLLEPQPLNVSYLLLTEICLSLLFVTIIHLLYTGLWMIHYHRQCLVSLEEEIRTLEKNHAFHGEVNSPEEPKKRTLLVHQGKGLVPVATEQIAYIFLANEVSIVRTLSGQSYTVDGTLEQLTEQLSSKDFFRISRQCIVQKGAIRKVDNESSGRLLLHIQPEHTEQLTVSRRRAPEFKNWMAR